jgi:hypothetical protein
MTLPGRLVMLAQHPNSRQPRRWNQRITPEDRSSLQQAATKSALG